MWPLFFFLGAVLLVLLQFWWQEGRTRRLRAEARRQYTEFDAELETLAHPPRCLRVNAAMVFEQGLAIVKHIVQAHGGEAWVRSEERRGAAFFFTLRQTSGH